MLLASASQEASNPIASMAIPSQADSTAAAAASFTTTHWSVVLTAARQGSPGADEALARLCQTYWYPLYAFIRWWGHTHHEAEDLTQGFFERLLDKNYLKDLTVEGGKFRSYLLTLLKHFMANEWNRERAKKRGGGKTLVSIHGENAETLYASEPADNSTPEALYEKRWGMTLLDQVMDRLRADYVARGKGELFAALKDHLTGAEKLIPYAELGPRFQMTEGAVKAAMHQLKKRYRELLRAEIAATVSSPEEIEQEIRHLIIVASR